MTDPQAFQELMISNADGALALADRKFQNVTFSDFRIPWTAKSAHIERVQFLDCSVLPGTCRFGGGAVLRRVRFINFSCGDAMHMASDVFLDRVVVSGHKQPAMIWIKAPARKPLALDYSDVDWCLDIREFYGEVSIAGPPVEKILRDPERHVLFDNLKLTNVDWAGLGMAPLSYWKVSAKKSLGSGAAACVFSLPPQEGRNYDRSMRELKILRNEGFLL